MEAQNLPLIEAPIGYEQDDEEVLEFAETAIDEIVDKLTQNRIDASVYTDVEKTVNDVLAIQNTRTLDIRARSFENPKVTLWLKDCPVWANDAWIDKIYPKGLNAFNGAVTVTFDVRPF